MNFLLQFVLIYMRLASYLNILWSLLALFFSLHSSVLCQLLLRLLLLRELKELMKFQLELYQFSWQARRRGLAKEEEERRLLSVPGLSCLSHLCICGSSTFSFEIFSQRFAKGFSGSSETGRLREVQPH